ncbi:metal ABC transporter solute-binding protein, Zn/Mn family [Paenibacillus senegalensis]|uniref:metal ABC transporter solute-binding protein, Zn/Mn family n=1 Tax=Paenibacillus senegalensis TaxID=1465766 RepID=UPI000289B539|nr:zinc ABC transporter substrate-binding protein [Paenibacillus senegalensis]
MKKNPALKLSFFIAIISVVILAGCGSNSNPAENEGPAESAEGLVEVVTSFYPLYDFASKIGGDHVNMTMLVPAGVEPHDWTPKSRDITTIRNADLFIYQGNDFEVWVDSVMKTLDGSEVMVVEASEGIARIPGEGHADHDHEGHEHEEGHADHDHEGHEHEEGHADHDHEGHEHEEGHADHDHEGHEHEEGHADHDHEGHEHEEGHADHDHEGHEHEEGHADHDHEGHEHEEDHSGHDHHGHSHDYEFDPHLWLSPVHAKEMAEKIKNALVAVDPANQADYEANYNELAERFDQLHAKFQESLKDVTRREIVVTHQAFGYLAHEYNLEQISIMGISPDAEPTAQDMMRIRRHVQDNGIKVIFFEELLSDSLAKTLANDAGVETRVLNPLEGLTPKQMEAGEDYFSIMEQNLENLIYALK